jgi:hypothetical protein
MPNLLERRCFLAGTLAAGASLTCRPVLAEDAERIAFFYVSDMSIDG